MVSSDLHAHHLLLQKLLAKAGTTKDPELLTLHTSTRKHGGEINFFLGGLMTSFGVFLGDLES